MYKLLKLNDFRQFKNMNILLGKNITVLAGRNSTGISALLDRTKFSVRDYSVPSSSPFDNVDRRYNVDPKIQKQIKYASVVVCSNRPANNSGMSMDEIRFAISIGKPVVAVKITESTSSKERADIVIGSNDEDGIAGFIENEIL